MKTLTLNPVTLAQGELQLPGSKSLSLRALLLASLARGDTHITNLLRSDDTERMIQALRCLAIRMEPENDPASTELQVTGGDGPFNMAGNTELFLGNSGASIRPLSAVLCLSSGHFQVTGDDNMRLRPIQHLVDALLQLDAKISYAGKAGYPPLDIEGAGLDGGVINIEGSISSQYLTSLLIALPLARGDSVINVMGEQVSKPYLDMTLDIMKKFGVAASHENYRQFHVPGGQVYQSPGRYMVEGDASSASYFLAAAAISGGTVRVHGIGQDSIQGDVQFVDVLQAMGAEVTRSAEWIEVTGGPLHGIDMDLNHIPDAAMTLATTALFAEGPTRIRNVYNWRVKETDRMHAMSTELRKLGATVETGDDYIVITPPAQLTSAVIDTYDDHRVAMSFSLAAFGGVPITINDPDCTSKTFPNYFRAFDAITK
jgi:3-phosphoshikimate 1-carboxyvinyltransferase